MDNGPHDLGGRIYYGCEGTAVRHLFGAVASPLAVPGNYLPFTQAVSFRETCIPGGCARTFVVSLTGRELQRLGSEAVFLPLTLADFTTVPAGVTLTDRSQLKFRINAQLDSGTRRFVVDANQTFEVQANSVCIEWVAPANFVEVAGRPVVPAIGGFVIDALLGCSAAAIEDPLGNTTCTFTSHLYVTAATRGIVTVPAFATDVTIYQAATLGASAVMWEQHYGNPTVAGSLEAGAIPFILGQRRTEQEQVLPNVSHFRSDIDPASDRWFILRWTIRP
jgi:hypothetical protein